MCRVSKTIIFYIISFFACSQASAQEPAVIFKAHDTTPRRIGLSMKLAVAQPFIGHFADVFNGAPTIEAGMVLHRPNRIATQRIGFSWVQFTPAASSFPKQFNYLYPPVTGLEVWSKLSVTNLYLDEQFRFFNMGHLSVQGGFGVLVGLAQYTYGDTYYPDGFDLTKNHRADLLIGLRNHISLNYSINKRAILYTELLNVMSINDDRNLKPTYNTLGVGFTWYFKRTGD